MNGDLEVRCDKKEEADKYKETANEYFKSKSSVTVNIFKCFLKSRPDRFNDLPAPNVRSLNNFKFQEAPHDWLQSLCLMKLSNIIPKRLKLIRTSPCTMAIVA